MLHPGQFLTINLYFPRCKVTRYYIDAPSMIIFPISSLQSVLTVGSVFLLPDHQMCFLMTIGVLGCAEIVCD